MKITIECDRPADCPEARLKQELEKAVRERLALYKEDKIIVKFREADRGGKGKNNELHKKQTCKHKEYCGGDCQNCGGTTGEANVWIAKGRGR